MTNRNFQKIISLLIIISLSFAVPFFRWTQVAQAQSTTSYISGISEALTQLPLCTSAITNKAKSIFSEASSSGGSTSGGFSTDSLVDEGGNYIGDNLLDRITDESIQKAESIPVYDEKIAKDVAEQGKKIDKIAGNTSTMKENDTCLKSIGRLLIKMLLQKLTISTVEWINGGYDKEGPLFVQDPEQYFKDIGRDEILRFGQEVSDPKLYPFAKDFMQAQVNSFKNKFANNAQYSLNKLINESSGGKYNAQDFGEDFSKGGWDAWNAMIQNSANNPLGFALMASNELGKRIEDKTELAKDSLQYGSGFLGVQKCADPEGVTKEEDDKARNGSAENGPFRKCNQWQTVTPGQMIASAATRTMQNEETSLLKADDLNDAIAALIDAFANSMTSKIQNDGFFGITKSEEFQYGMEGQFVYDYNNMVNYSSPQVEQDFSQFQISQSTFLSTHPNFNIRTDLTQALIDEQRIFIDKLIEQNRELYDKKPANPPLTGNFGLIPVIYQLDYCIPGPHPGWENDSRQVLAAALEPIIPETADSLKDKDEEEIMGLIKESATLVATAAGMAIGATVLSFIPVLGTAVGAVVGAIVGYLVGLVVDLFSAPKPEEKVRVYYGGHFANFTGTQLKHCMSEGGVCNEATEQSAAKSSPLLHHKSAFVDGMNIILNRYADIINATYTYDKLPAVTKEAEQKFLRLKGYGRIQQENEEKIVLMKSIVNRLETIKTKIDKLNCQINEKCINYPGTNEKAVRITQEQYNDGILEWAPAFSRISANMVSGNDIAKAENITKQIIDERDYIYKNLIKGPNGCEDSNEYLKGESGKQQTALGWQHYAFPRVNIGLPIMYDYNKFKEAGADLPDPYNSGYKTKMTREFWPGLPVNKEPFQAMLPLVQFEFTPWKSCGDPKYNPNDGLRTSIHGYVLCYSDLAPPRDYSGWVYDKFERMIGIY